jgi:phosphohistidine phosphatase
VIIITGVIFILRNLYLKKIIYFIRHAKSSSKDISIDDFDRSLNKRGKNDASMMAKFLDEKIDNIDLVISSPAKRTADTARIISKNTGLTQKIIFDKNIYEASYKILLHIINSFDDEISGVIFVGHNPELTDTVNYLSNEMITNIPTCGIVAIEFEKSWMDINAEDGKVIFFEYPKKYSS